MTSRSGVAIVRQLTSDAPFSGVSSAPLSGVADEPEGWRSVVGSVATGPAVVRATTVAAVVAARVVAAVVAAGRCRRRRPSCRSRGRRRRRGVAPVVPRRLSRRCRCWSSRGRSCRRRPGCGHRPGRRSRRGWGRRPRRPDRGRRRRRGWGCCSAWASGWASGCWSRRRSTPGPGPGPGPTGRTRRCPSDRARPGSVRRRCRRRTGRCASWVLQGVPEARCAFRDNHGS